MKTLDISAIQLIDFPQNQYYRETTDKKAIVLHHTVSGPGVRGDIAWWLQTAERIATHFIIERNGHIVQCFNSKYWAHHLGIKAQVFEEFKVAPKNMLLNQQSISIELDSWGGILQEKAADFDGEIVDYGRTWRGYRYFEAYTAAQLESARQLITYLAKAYNINLTYKPEMWNVNAKALAGQGGIWSHVSYRPDKSDCHPQPELIEMLKQLK